MGIIWWIIVGVIAGWATGKIMKGEGYGFWADMLLGIAGALFGGFIASHLGLHFSGLHLHAHRRHYRRDHHRVSLPAHHRKRNDAVKRLTPPLSSPGAAGVVSLNYFLRPIAPARRRRCRWRRRGRRLTHQHRKAWKRKAARRVVDHVELAHDTAPGLSPASGTSISTAPRRAPPHSRPSPSPAASRTPSSIPGSAPGC